jgi:transposase
VPGGYCLRAFAPRQAVYKAFVRWVEADAFERMQDRLRQQWRERMGAVLSRVR